MVSVLEFSNQWGRSSSLLICRPCAALLVFLIGPMFASRCTAHKTPVVDISSSLRTVHTVINYWERFHYTCRRIGSRPARSTTCCSFPKRPFVVDHATVDWTDDLNEDTDSRPMNEERHVVRVVSATFSIPCSRLNPHVPPVRTNNPSPCS